MPLPRQVVPGHDYMITRECSERRFFLRPDDEANNAFIYCLVLAAKRAKVDITFSVAMSNHHHTGIHDPDGNFPIFTERFHGLLARCQNAHLGRFESFLSGGCHPMVLFTHDGTFHATFSRYFRELLHDPSSPSRARP
jgi:putative transposase